jgi:hypothetical protein
MSNVTKNNKNNLLDIMHTKKIVSVAVIIAITAMFVFSNDFVNPLLAQSSKSTDKTGSYKSNDKSDGTKSSSSSPDTSSSSPDKTDYKAFQKCLSTAAGTTGFAAKTDIKACVKQIYPPTTPSSPSISPSTSSPSISPSTSSTSIPTVSSSPSTT